MFCAHASRQRASFASVGRGRTFGSRSATTGSLAVRSVRERWPSPRRRCYNPDRQWPAGGPRKTISRPTRGLAYLWSFDWGGLSPVPSDCDRLANGFLSVGLASVANRSVTCPTRLETRTKESNMCASRWADTKPAGEMKVKAFR